MRFFIDRPITQGAEIAITDAGIRHQLARVLRYTAGDTMIVLDGKGNEGEAVIQSITKDAVTVKVGVYGRNKNEPEYAVALYQSILKKDKMEFVFEKCTEIGVSRFVPMLSEHSVKQGVNCVRARKIVREAAEQSRRGIIPEISEIRSFADAVQEAKKSGAMCVLAHNEGDTEHLGDFARTHDLSGGINAFIGPEGGFSDAEVAHASQNGFHVVSLGKRTLRAETAAIVASFAVVEQ
ncbi:16S rRNA (uracil(1498)-N(3))-methyltransferase [Candidatus Azambacteria bacterium]|nr:16S rRNA (uracil(1498)-N(3))-methyltransferase [Candidatus Azambacteria bacterium]